MSEKPTFSPEARAAFILLVEEYAEQHVDPPGFEDDQPEWELLKSDTTKLDAQITDAMNDVFDAVYFEVVDAEWRRAASERAREREREREQRRNAATVRRR